MSNRKLVKAVKALFNPLVRLSHNATRGRSRRTARSNRRLVKTFINLFRPVRKLSRVASRHTEGSIWLMRSLLVTARRRRGLNSSGFVLPTVIMVLLVVILLTTAIVFRSFDRAKDASNVRVNQAVLNASAPAIDRAKAKLDKLFGDPRLPRSTPSDYSLYNVLSNNLNDYTFNGETQLELVSEFSSNKKPASQSNSIGDLDNDETLTTAWKYPVDTDNNGSYDSYTLYGIYFRTPTSSRDRSALEARTPPMTSGKISANCQNTVATSANLINNAGWYNFGGTQKKSIFVYTATVPITQLPVGQNPNYDTYKGNKGFSSLEYQQDRSRIPLNNNAVLYEDDLQITPGAGLKLNGRVLTNSNLLTGARYSNSPIQFFLVSSPKSCFYLQENSKIVVGGNVANSNFTVAGNLNNAGADLFIGPTAPTASWTKSDAISSTNQTTTKFASDIGYNGLAYSKRIDLLVGAGVTQGGTQTVSGAYPNFTVSSGDPQEVKDAVEGVLNTNGSLNATAVRNQQMEIYFRRRTRRVPYIEVPAPTAAGTFSVNPLGSYTSANVIKGSGNTMRPPKDWMFPFEPSDGVTAAKYADVDLKTNGSNKIELPATETVLQQQNGTEDFLGDRVLVGNNLPELWYKISDYGNYDGDETGTFVGAASPKESAQTITGIQWDAGTGTRTRSPQASQLSDLGITNRDGFWEAKAAESPKTALDVVGGMRVVTGAGIYSRKQTGSIVQPDSFLRNPPQPADNPNTPDAKESQLPVVWPDSTSMWDDTKNQRGDLVARATVVYHYAQASYDPSNPTKYQKPIACVSSYYDPSTKISVINKLGLPDIRLRDGVNNGAVVPGLADQIWDNTGTPAPSQPLATYRALTGLSTVGPLLPNPLLPPGTTGRSNNGVSYSVAKLPLASSITGVTAPDSNGLFTPSADDPTNAALPLKDRILYQANLVFPNGRFVNQLLRQALQRIASSSALTLSQQSAIDSAICALSIADGTLTTADVTDNVIPHGAIRETTLLDARQVKAIDNGTLTGNYDLNIEQRQPLEIRATVLDLDLLRQKTIAGGPGGQEYLLPNSGIIYATRDDALPDTSDPSDQGDTAQPTFSSSSTDWKLDPSRRPNGIMLINGSDLSRQSTYRPEEKGLILASNLPVYVKGNFNLHQHEEFSDYTLGQPPYSWSNFYNRAALDSNFACRSGQFSACTSGDSWRPATVLADAITVLSDSYRVGFRNEGDSDVSSDLDNAPVGYAYYGDRNSDGTIKGSAISSLDETVINFDLNKDGNITDTVTFLDETVFGTDLNGNGNATDTNVPITEKNIPAVIARRFNGFWDNNFVTNHNFLDSDYSQQNTGYTGTSLSSSPTPYLNSSYLNNFVTPVQRRVNFPEYVMELCPKLPVSLCGPKDWVGATDGSGTTNVSGNTAASLRAGTTARPAKNLADQRYPRRIAFNRNKFQLDLSDSSKQPTPLGIAGTDLPTDPATDDSGTVKLYKPSAYGSSSRPRLHGNALWFETGSTGGNFGYNSSLFIANAGGLKGNVTYQPLLVPVLQLQTPVIPGGADPGGSQGNIKDTADVKSVTNWLQTATQTVTNITFAQGDTPPRPNTISGGEDNGGVENLVRYLERWNGVNHVVSGSFIQLKRSAYATAPWQALLGTYQQPQTPAIFGGSGSTYPQGYSSTVTNDPSSSYGRSPFFAPPNRQWGFDVALLSQLPDLFSQQFTTPSTGAPDEYFREVGRDDKWVQTLLCAAQATPGGYEKTPMADYGTGYNEYALPADQRPSTCPAPAT